MAQIRLALAQVNPTVGDLERNAGIVVEWARRAAGAGAHLVAFPEMVLTGYPVEDLALRASFVGASRRTLERLAEDLAEAGLGELPIVVGYLDWAEGSGRAVGANLAAGSEQGSSGAGRVGVPRGRPQNCASVLYDGKVIGRYAKHHLPNYGVFDEFRIFVPGQDLLVARVRGIDVALAICEDLWQDGGPVARARAAGAGLLLVLNGSPYEREKNDVRRDLVAQQAAGAGCPLAYVNLVGGQDDLVFDGDSIVMDASGEILARAPQFDEHLLVVDLDLPAATSHARASADGCADGCADGRGEIRVRRVLVSQDAVPAYEPAAAEIAEPLAPHAEVYRALVVGLRDYVGKNGFGSVVLGLSGGIDSTLVATIACDAIQAKNVVGVSLPSRYSTGHSREDAADLARRTGLDYRIVPIEPMLEPFLLALGLTGIAAENLQARIRAVVLMGLSNQENHLCLTTGNKTELAVGYSTIYGDSVGGFNPVKDLPKTLVWELSRWRNAEARKRGEVEPIPVSCIEKVPSAELRPGQVDQDSLPPYELLDPLLEQYVERARGRAELLAEGFAAQTVDGVVTLVDRAEWKRRQSALGPKISVIAFGRDRRLPVTSRWREHES
jgi:NAD+ synthase (glutamine-hydrolysing)